MRVVVTGGGGFLGGRIVRQLLAEGHGVTSVSRSRYPELEALGVQCIPCDLADEAKTREALRGAEVVFHVAAKAGVWGKLKDYESANVVATRNVISACQRNGTTKLVHTSSPSVCFDGTDHVNAGNDLPLAKSFLAHYPETKARAEKLAIEANSSQLATCALRPHLVFGPGDPHIIPRLIDRARTRRLFIVGDGTNEVTVSYVENAAHAHLCAAKTLAPGAPHAGRAYFVGQEQPVVLWDWINGLLQRLDAPRVEKQLSERSAYRIGTFMETLWRFLPLPGEPPMTRFVATQLASSHSYDMGPAKRDFGYSEIVSMEEALDATVAAFR